MHIVCDNDKKCPSVQAHGGRGWNFGGTGGAGPGSTPEVAENEFGTRKTCKVRTERDERKRLQETLGSGKGTNERHRLAHIQFPSDEIRSDGGPGSAEIAEVLDLGTVTVERVASNA